MARGRHAKKIDSVHWTLGNFVFGAQAAGVVASTFLAAQHLPETLLRIRGEWVADFDGIQSAAIGVTVGVGIVQVPEGTGTTVLWSPISDGDAPWIWWDVMHLLYDEMVQDVIGSQMVLSGRRVIDSKAMRKLRNTELQVVCENVTGIGAATINAVGSARVLAGS